jgi:hypothetical protein
MGDEKRYTEEEAHRLFAAGLNGEVWNLLGKPDRSEAEDERMIHTAHASCHHWLEVGTELHHQRAEWLISRAYSEVGRAEPALRHARRCEELTARHADLMEDFDLAYARECMARAHALAGEREEARTLLALAVEAGQAIQDEESRKIFLGDLEGGNWHGLK